MQNRLSYVPALAGELLVYTLYRKTYNDTKMHIKTIPRVGHGLQLRLSLRLVLWCHSSLDPISLLFSLLSK